MAAKNAKALLWRGIDIMYGPHCTVCEKAGESGRFVIIFLPLEKALERKGPRSSMIQCLKLANVLFTVLKMHASIYRTTGVLQYPTNLFEPNTVCNSIADRE